MRTAERFGVDQFYAFVTSAVRDATNREEIMTRLEHEAGVRPQFLTGEDEARLTYHATDTHAHTQHLLTAVVARPDVSPPPAVGAKSG
jgi:exopolyphosphatase/pppGpp-phosphohydrolase